MSESELQVVGKIFRDPIHGHIVLDPLLVKIIDTPQFQRLRNLKQLGGVYHVYPGASHNRFEHSIGVAHLAGELVELLKQQQGKELDITNDDVLCVKVAGLCHDLGHGPFSHVFDGYFIEEARRRNPQIRKEWKHEDASADMFDHMLEENSHLSEPVLKDERNRAFIKEMITGKPAVPPETSSTQSSEDWPYYGRGKEKSFLYEIVANKETGIDVDKWDYFERDCYYLGVDRNFDMRRTMKLARVIEAPDGKKHICIRDKEAFNLYQMFHTRFSLFKRAYKHPTANGIELMIRDALIAADGHLTIPGKNDAPCKMSEAIEDMHAYTLLTDHVMHQILMSPEKELKQAKDLFHRIQRRELYKCAVNKLWNFKVKVPSDAEISKGIVLMQSPEDLSKDDIVVDVVKLNYGMKEKNPVDSVWFYTKKEPNCAKPIKREEISAILPEKFEEQYIRVYCKQPEKEATVKECFERWYEKQNELHSQGTPQRASSQSEEQRANGAKRELEF